MKLFTSILEDKLETQIKNAEEQQGFVKGRSITDTVFITKQIKEKAKKLNTPVYICFIDLAMAFDRVRLGGILNILIENKVPDNVTRTSHDVNTNNAIKVKAGGRLTKNIPTPGGIRPLLI